MPVNLNPTIYLKLEGLAVLFLTVFLYHSFEFSWWLFAVLFLVPDIFMLGYLHSKKMGALVYNIGHTYAVVIPVGIIALLADSPSGVAVGLIWAAPIGFDRVLGFGLKHESGFKATHLDPSM